MKTCSRLTLAFLLLIIVVPQVGADVPPENVGVFESKKRIKIQLPDGPYVFMKHYENGQKASEVHFKNGKLDGLDTEWDENGQKYSERQFKNGLLVSASAWRPDGTPCPETKLVDGSGSFVKWHDNGQKKSERYYKNGKEEGLHRRWHENGQKVKEDRYKNGKRDGLSTWWDENGNKTLEIQYKDGKEVSRKPPLQ